jgi:photosystem II stability/assembly factor-like uncharacterized protein
VYRGLLLAVALVGLLAIPAVAGINRWTSNGPYGGNVGTVVVDPSRPEIVYVGIPDFGVFKTVDGGAHWAAANEGLSGGGSVPVTRPLYVSALAVDPQTPSTLFVGLDEGGLFKSTDGAVTWHRLEFNAVTSIAIDPHSPSIVYVNTDAGIFRSDDGGTTWQSRTPPPYYARSIAMDPAHPSVLYVIADDFSSGDNLSIYRSQDGGASWTSLGLPSPNPIHLAVSVDGASRVFATTILGVFRSTDAGATWTQVLSGSFQPVVAVGPSDLYVAGGPVQDLAYPKQVFRSSDGGDHWSPLALSSPAPAVFASSLVEPSVVYGGASFGVVKSSDAGATWGLTVEGLSAVAAVPVADPSNPSLVYAASGGGLFRSGDGGGSWSLENPDPALRSVAIQPGTLSLYSLLGKSVDGGISWQPVAFPAPNTSSPLAAPVIVPDSPETMFLAMGGYPPDPGQLFKSEDGGGSWALALAPTASSYMGPVMVSGSGAEVYAPYSGRFSFGFVKSNDGGTTWNDLATSGWSDDLYFTVELIAVDPSRAGVVFANKDGKLYRSAVGGGQWVDISAGLPVPTAAGGSSVSSVVVDPTSGTTLYAATDQGVFRSSDGGASWTSFSDGLPIGATSGLVIDSSGRFLHVGARDGVYDLQISSPCVATATTLCLLGGRFIATVEAVDPRTGRLEVGTAVPQYDRYGYFSLPGFTGDPTFPEVVVKMADATAIGDGFWVFHSGLTDLQYTLSIVDTVTGRQKSYRNDRSDPESLCGGADTGTFTNDPVEDVQSSSPRSTRVLPGEGSPALNLLGRFQATLSVVDPRTGRTATGIAIPQGGGKWGFFGLPDFTSDPGFPEVFVKMLDGTALGGYFWVFHTGLTDLEYTLTVVDSKDGATKTYRNDRSDPSRLCGGADTHAFAN